MATVLYQKGIEDREQGQRWNTADLRMLLLRSDGGESYIPIAADTKRNHDFVASLFTNGAIELTAAGYARIALPSKVYERDDPNKRIEEKCDTVTFGAPNVATGQIVGALVIYRHVSTDGDSVLWLFSDTASNFPASTADKPINIIPPLEGVIQVRQATP